MARCLVVKTAREDAGGEREKLPMSTPQGEMYRWKLGSYFFTHP